MLRSLHIENLAIADALNIELAPGFNVLTGETGAGKSLFIKALTIVSGAKVSNEIIRSGADELKIFATFSVTKSHPVIDILKSLHISLEDTNTPEFLIIIRRIVSIKGRSQAIINDVPITLATLKIISTYLIDIFAQHETNRLLDPSSHLDYIDEFLDDNQTAQKVRQLFADSHAKLEELQSLAEQIHTAKRGQDYLEFRLQELEKLDPSIDDFHELKDKLEKHRHREKTSSLLQHVQALISSENPDALNSRHLRRASQMLIGKENTNKLLEEISQHLILASEHLEEALFKIEQELTQDDDQENSLENMEARFSEYKALMRKHQFKDIEELVNEKTRLSEELQLIASGKELFTELVEQGEKISRSLKIAADFLSTARLKAAEKISDKVSRELGDLEMKGAFLSVEFSPIMRRISELNFDGFDEATRRAWHSWKQILESTSESGKEKAQFLLSSNPGEPLYPLQKIASGGEMARIMLAIKKVLTSGASSCVLVFDEIDTGISGKVATVVGQKLKELSQSFQIICISHLPQVAVWADQHLLAQKKTHKQRLITQITLLDARDREQEIARLLSGADVTNPSLANARELLKMSKISSASTIKTPKQKA